MSAQRNIMPDTFLDLNVPRDLDELITRFNRQSNNFFASDILRWFGARPLHFYCIDTAIEPKIDPNHDDQQLVGYYVETRKDPEHGRVGIVRPVHMTILTRQSDNQRFAMINMGSVIDDGPVIEDAKSARKIAMRLRDEERERRGLK